MVRIPLNQLNFQICSTCFDEQNGAAMCTQTSNNHEVYFTDTPGRHRRGAPSSLSKFGSVGGFRGSETLFRLFVRKYGLSQIDLKQKKRYQERVSETRFGRKTVLIYTLKNVIEADYVFLVCICISVSGQNVSHKRISDTLCCLRSTWDTAEFLTTTLKSVSDPLTPPTLANFDNPADTRVVHRDVATCNTTSSLQLY